jgi:hypothetical protein
MHAEEWDEGSSDRRVLSPLPFHVPEPVVFIGMLLILRVGQYIMLFFAGNVTGSGSNTFV